MNWPLLTRMLATACNSCQSCPQFVTAVWSYRQLILKLVFILNCWFGSKSQRALSGNVAIGAWKKKQCPGLRAFTRVTPYWLYHEFLLQSYSKSLLQNLDQTSASKSCPNKIKLKNIDQTALLIFWPKLSVLSFNQVQSYSSSATKSP